MCNSIGYRVDGLIGKPCNQFISKIKHDTSKKNMTVHWTTGKLIMV